MPESALTPRAAAIRKDLEALRKAELLAGPDWQLDYMAGELEYFELGGWMVWPDSVKPRKKRVKDVA